MGAGASARTRSESGAGGAGEAAGQAWRAMFDLSISRATHERFHRACEALDLSPGLIKALISLRPGDSRPMKDLAPEWRCDASYVTALVDGLEERGIVARQANPTDRRAKTIALTAQGEQTRAELLQRLYQPPSFFGVLTVAEQRELGGLLAKLLAAAEAVEPAT